MPTIKHQPKWGSPPGLGECLFSEDKLETLAEILEISVDKLKTPLKKAAEAISVFEYTEPTSLTTQRAGLRELAEMADQLQSKLGEMDPDSRQRLLSEYAAEALDSASPECPAARYHARYQLDADRAAVARLYGNLGTAAKRIEIRRGAPEHALAHFAAL